MAENTHFDASQSMFESQSEPFSKSILSGPNINTRMSELSSSSMPISDITMGLLSSQVSTSTQLSGENKNDSGNSNLISDNTMARIPLPSTPKPGKECAICQNLDTLHTGKQDRALTPESLFTLRRGL